MAKGAGMARKGRNRHRGNLGRIVGVPARGLDGSRRKRWGGYLGTGFFELCRGRRTPETVVANFHESSRQDVLQEPRDEVLAGDRDVLQLVCLVVAIVEGNLTVVDRVDAAVADGDAVDVAGEVGEDGLSASSVLAVHDPVLLPDLCRSLVEPALSA